jgi:hypothetical protein
MVFFEILVGSQSGNHPLKNVEKMAFILGKI